MKTCLNPGIPEAIFQTIMGWDMSPVRERLKFKRGLNNAQLDELELGYKQYVCLMVSNPGENFVVSVEIDDFSHDFILFTEHFASFQKAIGGRLEHIPVKNEQETAELADSYHNRSIPMLCHLFGDTVNLNLWGQNRMICTCNYIPNPVAA